VLVDGPQFDARAGKGRCHLPQHGTQVGLELSLHLWVGPHMTRPRFAPAGLEPPPGAPAQLTADAAPKTLGQPLGHGGPAPAVALGMGAG
jgi:hypothetical protein